MRAPISFLIKWPAALALIFAVAACAGPRKDDITGSLPDDHNIRHPINVTRGMATMDLLPGGGPGGLTDRQVGDVQSFAADWRKRGRGPLTIQVPTGADAATDTQSAFAAKEIRRIFTAMGIPRKAVATARYPADGPGHLAPVRLEYPILEARLPHECGQWQQDAGFSDPMESNRNRQHWNFGCAAQQNLAAQVDDPEDFIRPRSEDPISAARRASVMDKYRKGEPTATTYPTEKVDTQE
jgi:pilus assembly protein CpaD